MSKKNNLNDIQKIKKRLDLEVELQKIILKNKDKKNSVDPDLNLNEEERKKQWSELLREKLELKTRLQKLISDRKKNITR